VRPDEYGLGGLSRPYTSVGWLSTREGERVQSRPVFYYLEEVFPVDGPEVVDGMADVGCKIAV